ncbi:MAG: hypothetical protein VB137_11325 [Burkholderia sp.]
MSKQPDPVHKAAAKNLACVRKITLNLARMEQQRRPNESQPEEQSVTSPRGTSTCV